MSGHLQIALQLATAREAVPEGAGSIHEIKHDGYRLLAVIGDGPPRLLSRNNLDWSLRFREVAAALKSVRAREAVLDGEVVALDANGNADMAALKAMCNGGRRPRLAYFAFDLLSLDGKHLRAQPLLKRKARLARLVPKRLRVLHYVEHAKGDGVRFFIRACEIGMEGIVSKRADAPYEAGRSLAWIKVKCVVAKEFAIGGYVPSDRRAYFRSLIVGEPGPRGLVYRGQVGGGFTAPLGKKIAALLAPLETDLSPFEKTPWALDGKVRWVRPE